MAEKHVSTLVINPSGGQESGHGTVQTTSSSSFSSSSQATKSVSSTKSMSSSSTKTVTSSTTVKKSSTTSTKSMSMMSSSMTSSNNIAIKSSNDSFMDRFGKDFGIDVNKQMDQMKISMDDAVKKAREEMFSLTKLEKIGTGSDIVKLDNKSIMDYVDKSNDNNLKFNFDVDEFESESISVKAVGNQIEVHGQKKVKKGDDETNEEFSRTYEMPTQQAIDSGNVTTSFFKDGILTVELPYDSKAVEEKKE